MDTINKPFNQLLEHYVFSVANKYIQRVDPHTQTRLIDLINQLNEEDGHLVPDANGNNSLLNQTALSKWEQEIKQLLEQAAIALLLLLDMESPIS